MRNSKTRLHACVDGIYYNSFQKRNFKKGNGRLYLLIVKIQGISAVPGKNFVESIFDEIEFLFIFNLLEKTTFHCVFENNKIGRASCRERV